MTISDGYAETETVLRCGNFPPLTVTPGSLGNTRPGCEVSAIDHEGSTLPPTEMRGEIVKAYVILAPGYTPSPELATDLQEHVKRVTAPYKYPREIEFVDSLPKTISGKIRRVELREMEQQKKLGK